MPAEARADDFTVGEPRWPMACAVIAAMVLTVLLPDSLRAGPKLLLPVLAGLLLAALIVGDPGKIDRRSRALRRSRSGSRSCSSSARCGRPLR